MAKVKFPLEMANGVYARTLEELKQNFDIKKVMSYFLDGRLKTWLEDRYYDVEAEKIGILNSNDEDLAQKLCEVFEQDFSLENDIDAGQVQIENERVEKLKQYTDDEEIIKNVNSVAFNQEELVELYKEGREVIYLCDGIFKIQDDKKKLSYYTIGNATVEGLTSEEDYLYGIKITDAGESSLKLMGVVRNITSVGLADAKEITQGTIWTLKDGLKYDEALKMRELLTENGAMIELVKIQENSVSDIADEVEDDPYGIKDNLKEIHRIAVRFSKITTGGTEPISRDVESFPDGTASTLIRVNYSYQDLVDMGFIGEKKEEEE